MFQHDLLHFHFLPFIAFSFSPFTAIYYIFYYIFITSCNWGAFITIYSIYYKRYLHLFHLFHLWQMVLCINTIYSIYYRLGGNLDMNVYIWKLMTFYILLRGLEIIISWYTSVDIKYDISNCIMPWRLLYHICYYVLYDIMASSYYDFWVHNLNIILANNLNITQTIIF